MIQKPNAHKPPREGTVPERHKELFHYTSISALKKILESNSLWATDAKHLNDQSEMELIWPPMKEQVIERYQSEMLAVLKRNPGLKGKIDFKGRYCQIWCSTV